MLSPGFLGTRADWLMDLVIVSLVVIVPVIVFSWLRVRRGDYRLHKRIQVWLSGILAVVVLLFELDLRLAGGMTELTRASRFFGTPLLDVSTWIHLSFSVSTALIWIVLVLLSLRRFGTPPRPTRGFSAAHRFWGRLGMTWMVATGVTGLELYIVGFAF